MIRINKRRLPLSGQPPFCRPVSCVYRKAPACIMDIRRSIVLLQGKLMAYAKYHS